MSELASEPWDVSGTGRLLRGGRLVARLVLVWVLVAVALRVLDLMLDDFAMPRWWQPTVFAAMYGLSFVRGFAGAVSLGFDDLFTPADAKIRVLFNNGLAALV